MFPVSCVTDAYAGLLSRRRGGAGGAASILTAENKVIAEGGGFDLSADPAATAVRTLNQVAHH